MAREVSSRDIEKEAWIVLAAVLAILLLPILGVWFVKFVHWYSQSILMWF
jgi:nitrate reductase NapE component